MLPLSIIASITNLGRKPAPLPPVKPWDSAMPWGPDLYIDAKTYSLMPSLFKVTPEPDERPTLKKGTFVMKSGWLYRERLLSARTSLWTRLGAREGVVRFNAPVVIPMLYELTDDEPNRDGHGWRLWMSLTPMEHFSLRPGVRLAKGHTVVCGMGMGYQLLQVLRKRSVDRVTLIERDQHLVDWLLPVLKAQMGPDKHKLCVIVDDATEVLRGMHADVALVDIFPGYGGNRLEIRTPGIGKLWCWGAAGIGDGY